MVFGAVPVASVGVSGWRRTMGRSVVSDNGKRLAERREGMLDPHSTDLEVLLDSFNQSNAAILSDRIYAALQHAILVGDLLPNTRLSEKELTDVLPVSRTPVREALWRLEMDELVVSSPNRGTVVRGINLRDLLEVYETLEVLESYAAETAVSSITKQTLEQLGTHLELAEFHIKRHQWEETTHHSVEFHNLIYETAGNRRLWKIIGDLREVTHSFRRFRLRNDTEAERGLAQHRIVLEALARRDATAAAAAMRDHVSRSTALVREAIRDEGSEDCPFQSRQWVE